jgi:uncharacterized membrane protein YedE/YeeE
MTYLIAVISGSLFALGLGLGGMTQPARVIGFLDVAGAWDPSLALVMAGAVGMTFLTFPAVLRRPKPILDQEFHLPRQQTIDSNLVVGAGLFGIGWGISGYCPGPALVSLATLNPTLVVYVIFMLGGLWSGRSLRG